MNTRKQQSDPSDNASPTTRVESDNPEDRPGAFDNGFLRSPLLPIFIVVTVDIFGLTMFLPVMPFYAKHFGATDTQVGLLAASFAVCQLIAGPILGRLSDRSGRKRILIASQIGTFIGYVVMALAGQLWMLFLARIIDGLTAGNLSIAQAYISDVTKPSERTKAFGLIGIAFGAGFMIGPAVSGTLADIDFRYPPIIAGVLSLASIFCTIYLLPHVDRSRATPLSVDRAGGLAAIGTFFTRELPRRRLLEFFFFVLSFAVIVGGGLALFLEHRFGWGSRETGFVYAFSGLVGGLVQGGLIGRLAKRIGEERLATIGFISMAIGYALLGWTFVVPMLIVVIMISAFGSAVTRPALTTLITKSVGPEEQGAALGVSQSLSSVAMIIGPILAGVLIDADQILLFALSAALFAAIGATFGLRRWREESVVGHQQ